MWYDSWDMEWNWQNFLSFWAISWPFTPLTQKIKILQNKKTVWRYYHFTHVYHNDSHDVWFQTYGAWQTEFFVILGRFLPFYPPSNPKNQNFEKMKKKPPADIIILHRCTINNNHMVNGSWDIKHYRQNFLTFWTILDHLSFCNFLLFCHFGP